MNGESYEKKSILLDKNPISLPFGHIPSCSRFIVIFSSFVLPSLNYLLKIEFARYKISFFSGIIKRIGLTEREESVVLPSITGIKASRASALTVSRFNTQLPVPQPLAYAVCRCQVQVQMEVPVPVMVRVEKQRGWVWVSTCSCI